MDMLKSTDKYLGQHSSYIKKSSIWLTINQIITGLSGLLLSVAFAHLVDPYLYGTYKYILSIISILAVLTLPGLNSTYTQSVARGKDGDLYSILRHKIRAGFFVFIILGSIAFYYFLKDNSYLALAFLCGGLLLPLSELFSIYDAYLQGKKNISTSVKFNVLIQCIYVGFMLITLYFFSQEIILFLIVNFLSLAILRYIAFKYVCRKSELNQEKEVGTLQFGYHLTFSNIIPVLSQYIDRIIVFQFIGPIQLAIYNFAIAIPDQIKSYFKSIQSIATPILSTSTSKNLSREVTKKTIFVCILIIISAILYTLIAPTFFGIFFPKYSESIRYSQVYSISIIAAAAVLPIIAIQARKMSGLLYKYNTIRSIIQILSLIVFGYFFGLWGIIIARIINELISVCLILVLVKKVS
jgi:O-antigen/teichoic acid export membrane protein